MRLDSKSRAFKITAIAAIVLFCIWVMGVVLVYHVMQRPPEQFGQAMKHVPGPAFMLIPFETLWNRARSGTLHPGQAAPEFALNTVDHQQQVTLSQLKGKPVVLVFGSYT